MSGHFELDVDPDAVRAAATRLTGVASRIATQASGLRGALPGIESSFQGKASTALRAEAEHLAGLAATSAPDVASAARALSSLAEDYETAKTEQLPRLNREWDAAETAHATAARADPDGLTAADDARSAEHARLTREFAQLTDDLRTRTRSAGAAMGRATIVGVPPGMVASYTAGGIFAPLLHLAMAGPDPLTALGGRLPLTALAHALESPPGPGAGSAELEKLLGEARSLGLAPKAYAPLLQSYYQALAFEHAGIDPARWRPELGAEANKDIIFAVYTYYGKLFLDHPELQWAGMANMIGPSFAAGFFDLASMRDFAHKLAAIPGAATALGGPGLEGIKALAGASDDELKFFETKFLTMQKNIFLDQAAMHEAYLHGGVGAIEEMRDAGLVNSSAVNAWTDIDTGKRTGNPALISAGNTALLHREQYDIIADDYDAMRNHDGPVGQGLTYAMTAVGAPSIPGAHAFGDVFPLHVKVETPGPERIGTPSRIGTPDHIGPFHIPSVGVDIPHVSVDDPLQGQIDVRTPLPDGNISQRDERWAMISQDTLPAYQHLLADDPAQARAIIASPIQDRVADHRLGNQVDDILGRMTHWSVSFHQ